MYEAFYELTAKPFQLNPDPSFYFGSKQHRRAMAYLEYGIHQNEGFIVVTGEIGAGKTTIVRGLLKSLDEAKLVVAHLVSTQLDADDTLRMVAAAYGVRTRDLSKADLLLALEAFLVDVARQGKRCLLIVDEAQNLTPRAVEELRMLSNFQFETQALLQSFLIGQPEFRATMNSPDMQQLRQRVIAACHIGPMDLEETKGYIQHRLKCAGSKGKPQFQEDAYEAIFNASGGIPRRINAVCDRLLLLGFLNDKKLFTRVEVDSVAAELNDRAAISSPTGNQGRAVGEDLMSLTAIDTSFSELELAPFDIDKKLVTEAAQLLGGLKTTQTAERLIRLERSLLRLEGSNSAILHFLKKLADAMLVRSTEKNEE